MKIILNHFFHYVVLGSDRLFITSLADSKTLRNTLVRFPLSVVESKPADLMFGKAFFLNPFMKIVVSSSLWSPGEKK